MSSDSSETNEIITTGRRSTRTVSRRGADSLQAAYQQGKRQDRRMSVSTELTEVEDDSSSNSTSEEEEEPIVYCQSCQLKTEQLEKVPINLHHLDDAFYCAEATESSNVKSSVSKVLSAEDGHSSLVGAVEMGVKEMVSTEPTTMAIPDEFVVLCKICESRFKKQRLLCDECNFVPRIDERFMRECCRCFEGFICKC